MSTKVNLTYNQLRAVKHASNLQALDSFVKSAERKGIRPGAPWEAVLRLFVEWKQECERIQGLTPNAEEYMQSVNEAIDEARAIIEN
jgi:hypothetical protein